MKLGESVEELGQVLGGDWKTRELVLGRQTISMVGTIVMEEREEGIIVIIREVGESGASV